MEAEEEEEEEELEKEGRGSVPSKVNDFAPVPVTEETVTRGYPVPPELGLEHRSDDDDTQYVAVQIADAMDTVEDTSTVEKSRPDMVTTTPPEPAELVPST